MFRSIFDHPQRDIFFFFTSVTKDKIIWFVVACLLYSLQRVVIWAVPFENLSRNHLFIQSHLVCSPLNPFLILLFLLHICPLNNFIPLKYSA